MGEIADMMLEGLLDEETGELIDGEAPGFPRRMSDPDCPYIDSALSTVSVSKSRSAKAKAKRTAKRKARRQRQRARKAVESAPL